MKIITILLICISFTSTAFAENISPIDELSQYGVVSCYEEKENDFVTRYECIYMLLQLCGFDEEQCSKYNKNVYYYSPLFDDLSGNEICYDHFWFAHNKGIVYGVTDTLFEPNRYATYQEAAAFATRINGNKNCSMDAAFDVILEEALRTNTIDKSMYDKKTENITYSDWCQILMNIIDCQCIIDAGTGLDYEKLTYRQLLETIMQQNL